MTSGQAISKLKHDKKYSNEVIEPLEKEHKVLEIIKEKPRTLFLIKTCDDYDAYLALAQDIALIEDVYSPKEYKLLKEESL